MAASQAMQSKLRLPGHSRASTGGVGITPTTARRRRASTGGQTPTMTADTQLADHAPNYAERQSAAPKHVPTQLTPQEDASVDASPSAVAAGGHIRVAVRVRPLPENEAGIIEVSGNRTVLIQKDAASGGNGYLSSQQGRIETRCFDRAFGPSASQKELFEYSCAPLIKEAVSSSRCATIFAYGATGAGKTHTMFGEAESEQQGIILRAVPNIFNAISEYNQSLDSSEARLQVKVSFLEIYNETVRDLLQEGGGMCKVLEDERRGVVQVSNLVEPTVTTADDAFGYLEAGMLARTIEATAANLQSSRAHAVFSLTIERVLPEGAQCSLRSKMGRSIPTRQLHSKISFVDLAGSERAAVTENVGQALKDGARINQSLLALANCIDALTMQSRLASTSAPRRKPPYRDSKLTLMLKASLMGDGLVAMIANVHPGRSNFEDSNNTLEYAKRASMVKATSSRLSRQSFGCIDEKAISSVTSTHPSGDADEESAASTSSSRSRQHRQRATQESQPGDKEGCGLRNIANCENTTASSPEECLSEISLSSGHEALEEVDLSSHHSPMMTPTNAAKEGIANIAEQPQEAWEESAQLKSDISTKQGVTASLSFSPQQPSIDEYRLMVDMVAKLQQDNERWDSRLRKAKRELCTLRKNRQELEEDNERLRQESIEKDRQILRLLSRCDPTSVAI